MTIQVGFEGVTLFLLVFTRFAGMIAFNPLFSRSNVPARVRVGLVMFLSFMMTPVLAVNPMPDLSGFGFVLALIREIAVGFIYGYIFVFFYYFLFFAGDLIDTDMGLAMAKTFDPATNIQVSFSGSVVTLLFALYIFASGSHLALIRMFADSFEMIPPGTVGLSTSILTFMLRLLVSVFLLALRLAAPFMVAEFTLQASMGILMRFIPQITIFVINFQLRILLGLAMLFLFAPFTGQFIDNYITVMFDALIDATTLMAGA